eukprot:GFUD01031655.1.p1 GENE.GFUD01031655.1~~GFUD01031655.1.p1  ORF type:complete len:534 (+),score=125.90 GFUD01031655.1:48-1649(+)
MKSPTAKSVTSISGINPRLGVRMKTQTRCKSQDSVTPRFPKAFPNMAKDVDSVADPKLVTRTRTLAPSPRYPPKNFEVRRAVTSCSNSRTSGIVSSMKPTKDKKICNKTFAVKTPVNSRGCKLTDNPRPQIRSKVNIVQQLKKKDSELVSLRQKRQVLGKSNPGTQSPSLSVLGVLDQGQCKDEIRENSVNTKSDIIEQDLFLDTRKELEAEINHLQNNITLKDAEIVTIKQDNLEMSEKVSSQLVEINILQGYGKLDVENIEIRNQLDLIEKNHDIALLKQKNLKMEEDIRKQKAEIVMLHAELKKLSELACTCKTEKCSPDENSLDLEKETADFLEKVSAVCKNKSLKVKALSKDKNVKINLKITVRKEKVDKVSNQLSFSEALESPFVFGNTPCQSFSVKEEYEDNVFCDNPRKLDYEQDAGDAIEKLEPSKNINDSELLPSESECLDAERISDISNVPIGTFSRVNELDLKLQDLSTRLSSQNEALEELKSEKRKFTSSVNMMEEELKESLIQHNRLQDQVNIVKQLSI